MNTPDKPFTCSSMPIELDGLVFPEFPREAPPEPHVSWDAQMAHAKMLLRWQKNTHHNERELISPDVPRFTMNE